MLNQARAFFNTLANKSTQYPLLMGRVLLELWHIMLGKNTIERAYAIAFNLTLAIFPATILIFTLIPYVPIVEFVPKLISFLKEIMPGKVYEALAPTIQDTLSQQRSGLLSFGVVYYLLLSTNGMMSLLKNFNSVDPIPPSYQRTYLYQRIIALLLTLSLTIALVTTLILLIGTRQVLDCLVNYKLITTQFQIGLLSLVRHMIVLVVLFIAIASIYYLAPENKKHKRFISIGAIIATMASLSASLAFTYYINNFLNHGIYGSLGGMIALMLWLFLLSFILLLGFEINIALARVVRYTTNTTKPFS